MFEVFRKLLLLNALLLILYLCVYLPQVFKSILVEVVLVLGLTCQTVELFFILSSKVLKSLLHLHFGFIEHHKLRFLLLLQIFGTFLNRSPLFRCGRLIFALWRRSRSFGSSSLGGFQRIVRLPSFVVPILGLFA